MVLSRDEILARKGGVKTEQFDIPGVGTVVIRGLTRNEALQVRDAETTADKDNTLISHGLVEPKMSVDDVAAWADNESAGVMAALSERIGELSGMTEGAGKSRVPRTRRRS